MELKKNKLFNPEGEADWGKRKIVGGNSTNLIELNNIKYDWAYKMYRTMMNNFWIPEEIPLGKDNQQYETLSDEEKDTFNRVISFLIFLDSIQTHNLPNINEHITAPEVSLCLTVQAFQEAVHSQSYGYILDSVVSAELRQKIYQLWREDTRLLERNKFITDIYESFIEKQDIQELVKVCMANYILEGIYFYSGFATIYSYARKGVLLGVASEIRYIQRDELTHLALFQNIFRELQRENPHLFTPELVEELREMMRQAVEMEIRWGQYVTGGKIAGLSDTNIDQYIKWLSNQRLKNIGIEPLYPEVVENPVKWVDQFSSFNAQKTDFFEQKVLNYSKSANVDWDDL